MPVYRYDGKHYSLPDGLSDEQALAKIKAHLGGGSDKAQTGQPMSAHEFADRAPEWAKAPVGVGEAALSMVAGIPSQIAGGLYGLGKLATGQGIDAAGNAVRQTQESNFGFGAYEPISDVGKRYSKKAQEVMALPGEKAGDVGAFIGKALGNEELGRLTGQLPVDAAMNFLPLHVGVTAPVKGVKKLLTPKDKAVVPTDPVLDNVQKALETPPETPVAEPKAPDVMRVTPEGQAYDPSVEAWRQRALELEQQAKERQTPKSNESQQMQLFDQPEEGRFTSPYEAATRDWRIDENGMPIAADLSMDVQNAANPLQRNLWGDELPSKRNPIGPHATLEDAYRQHQDIGQGGIPLTEAIDGMPKAERSRAIASELTGAIDPTGHLLGAMAESRRRGGMQSGAIDSEIFKAAFRNINKKLSALTDQPWVKQAFPATLYHTNPDGTPMVLLHGTRDAFNDRPRTVEHGYEGLHAGYGNAATFKAAHGTQEGKVAYRAGNLRYEGGNAVYPVVLRKGNYPRLPNDYGSWAPMKLADSRQFKLDLGRETGLGFYAIDDLMTSYKENILNKTLSPKEENMVFAKMLKDQLGIDGFFYPNTYENAKRAIMGRSGEMKSPQRARDYAAKLGLDDSVVVYNDDNMQSLYDSQAQTRSMNSGMSRGQRGGLNIRDIARTADEATTKLKAALRNALPARTDADKLLGDTIRDNSFIVKHKSGEEMAAAIAAGPDYPFWELGQSGLVNAGDKAGNAGVSMVGRALNWSKNMENKLVRDHVKPVEKHFSLLPKQDLQHAMKVMHMEDQANKRLTPEQLREAGVSDKAIEAIQQFRKVTDQGIEMINANNKLLGMKEVSRRDAYFSSQSNGDYVIRGTDANGKPIFTTAETLWGAKKAQKWIQENVPGAKDLKMIDRRDGYQGRGPRDVTNTYETLMEVFHDTPMGAELQQLMEQYKQNQAFDARGFSSHFLDKSGARFFLGDRPWLSAEKNAEQAAQAQVKYLKDMYRWIPAQEMMVDVKKVLGNEELQQSHPHSMSLINAYVNQYFGVAENILRRFEDKAGQAMGLSGSVMRSQLAGVKSMTYHLQLGFSAGYAIATPLQMLPMSTASHMMLSNQGLKHNPIITTAKTLRDVNYALKVRTGELVGANLSRADRVFANEAIRFMEDNGVITKTFRDEYASLGSHPVLDAAAKISEKTITAPDHFARMLGFFSFAHHLKDSGVKMSNLEIFQKAAELTEKAAVPLDRHNRPLLFDQFGMVGEAASMYKAPVFQYYNNLIELGSSAYKTKNFKPFIAFLAISYAMGGMLGLPGVKEADSVIELMKDWMSKMPGMEEASIKMKDFGIRQSMMDYTPDWNTYGALSKLTGINLQSRFTNEAFDAQHPLGAFSPVAQEMKEWGSLGLAALHRDKASVEQGIYDAVANPMMKGWMENNLSDFQGTTAGGKTQVIKPTNIRSHTPIYVRDDREKLLRSLGLYSIEEAKTREVDFRGKQDDMRMSPVRDRLIGELVHKLITKQNTDGYVQKFFEAGGKDDELATLLDRKLTSTMGTPAQLAVIKANTIREFQSIQRNQRRGMKY